MADDTKKSKTDTTPKKEAAAKVESPTAKEAPKDKAKDAPKDAPKPEGGETAAATPSSYSRGEGQKPVTAAYKDNWNAIFAKKKKKRKKR